MHKRKDYYHAGGYNGKGLRKEWEELREAIDLRKIKREPVPYLNEPPDNKPSLLKRVTNLFKGRTKVQKG